MFNIRNPNCEMLYAKKGNWNIFNATHPFSGLSLGKNVSDVVGKIKMKINTSFRWYWRKKNTRQYSPFTKGFRLMDKRKLSFILRNGHLDKEPLPIFIHRAGHTHCLQTVGVGALRLQHVADTRFLVTLTLVIIPVVTVTSAASLNCSWLGLGLVTTTPPLFKQWL